MARIIPDGWRELAVTGAAQREIDTLKLLAEALPADYTVYHGVHWTNLERGYAVHGEVDFVIVNAAGELLLIEQKCGFLDETPDGLVKRYPGRVHSIPAQLARSAEVLRGKLGNRPGCAGLRVDFLLYCPDYRVRQPLTAGLDAERIVDSERRDALAAIIGAILPPASPGPASSEVHRFLRDIIQLEADVSALVGRAREMVTRVAGGLAHWARQLDFQPFRLRVTGTAGSGKTQLALAEYRAALEAGRRPLYVCFNRPLADHFNLIAPPGGQACTVHQLCHQRLRAAGRSPDFSAAGAFDRMVLEAEKLPVDPAFRFDSVIVDEGQDFPAAWRDLVFAHAHENARLLWLEDPLQNLYARDPVALPGWVGLRAHSNYRSPRPVVRMLQALIDNGPPIEAASPLDADEVEVITYEDTEALTGAVKEAIRRCYAAGFRKEDVAVVSFRGREHSRLFGHTRIGPHSLRQFTGRYDNSGQPLFTTGEVLLESVYRFKGQAAAAVILAEVDFDALDDATVRKLFVGATRATMKLVVVASARASAALRGRGIMR